MEAYLGPQEEKPVEEHSGKLNVLAVIRAMSHCSLTGSVTILDI